MPGAVAVNELSEVGAYLRPALGREGFVPNILGRNRRQNLELEFDENARQPLVG